MSYAQIGSLACTIPVESPFSVCVASVALISFLTIQIAFDSGRLFAEHPESPTTD
jgi:hypothetical protein